MTLEAQRLRACRAVALLVASAVALACASRPPVAAPARRAQESTARAAAPPPLPSARPAALEPPPELQVRPDPASLRSRPLSAVARAGGPGAVAREVVLLLEDLRFAPGDGVLDARSRRALDALVARLRLEPPGWVIEIQGHADAAGPEVENLRIGLARAEAVRDYLARAGGIARERIAVVSLGSSHPAGDDSTAAGRARNRRAVVLVLR